MFLRNYWYVAASGSEIGRKPFRRIILNEPVVFYRTEDGTPVALEDRCPHRRLPLSMGKLVEGDVLQCHYHGLRFDRTGACVRVPGQDMIPRDRAGEVLSGGRALQVAVDLDGRSGARRSRQDHRLPLVRRSRTGAPSPTISTPSATGSSSTTTCSISRISPSCTRPPSATWRWWSTPRCAVQAHADRRAGDALDHRPAGAAGLRQDRRLHRQRRPLADHRLSAAVVHPSRRRRDADRHRRAGRPPRRRHPDAQPQRHHAGDRDHDALLLGRRRTTSSRATRR